MYLQCPDFNDSQDLNTVCSAQESKTMEMIIAWETRWQAEVRREGSRLSVGRCRKERKYNTTYFLSTSTSVIAVNLHLQRMIYISTTNATAIMLLISNTTSRWTMPNRIILSASTLEVSLIKKSVCDNIFLSYEIALMLILPSTATHRNIKRGEQTADWTATCWTYYFCRC